MVSSGRPSSPPSLPHRKPSLSALRPLPLWFISALHPSMQRCCSVARARSISSCGDFPFISALFWQATPLSTRVQNTPHTLHSLSPPQWAFPCCCAVILVVSTNCAGLHYSPSTLIHHHIPYIPCLHLVGEVGPHPQVLFVISRSGVNDTCAVVEIRPHSCQIRHG